MSERCRALTTSTVCSFTAPPYKRRPVWRLSSLQSVAGADAGTAHAHALGLRLSEMALTTVCAVCSVLLVAGRRAA